MLYSSSTALSSVQRKAHLAGLDHLRAFAILLVYLFHYRLFGHPAWEGAISRFGWTGVDLFFVLSGYLIASQLFATIRQGKTISLPQFFIKRFFRIIPPYLAVLALYLLFPFLREREHLAPLWKYLTFTLNFGLDLSHTGTFTHAWSLCIEEQFYLVLPIIIWLLRNQVSGRQTAYLLLALCLGGLALRLIHWNQQVAPALDSDNGLLIWYKSIYYPTYTRLDGLLAGVGIAGLFTFHPHFKNSVNRYANVLVLAGAAVWVAACFVCDDQTSFAASVWGFPMVALGCGLMVAGSVCPACVLYRFESKLTTPLATLSYSIYLVHKMTIHTTQTVLANYGLDANGTLMFMLCLGSTAAAALLLRWIIEKPALHIRNRILYPLNGVAVTD